MASQTIKREELYEQVWSEPMKTLATRYGISDVALSRTCRDHGIPVPSRGYWAKLQAGKKVSRQPLPARGIGIPQIIRIGRNHYWFSNVAPDDLIEMEIPPPPEFLEPISELRQRVRQLVGRVTIPRDFSKAHRHIAKLLEADEERRQKQLASQYPLSFDAPYFESPFERRRLRLFNAILVSLERCGMKCTLRGKNPSDVEVRVGKEHVTFALDHPGQKRHGYWPTSDAKRPASDKLQLRISPHRRMEDVQVLWEDKAGDTLETHVLDLVVSVIVAGEVQYRQNEIGHHRWLTERKAQLIKEARQRKEEAERQERERQRQIEQARVNRLLGEAASFRQASDIRAYVDSARQANAISSDPVSEEKLSAWAQWALAQANRIDPVLSKAFLNPINGDRDEASTDEG